jgi:hypothetical protein
MNLFGQQTPNKQQDKSQEARASEKLSSGNGLKIVKRTGSLFVTVDASAVIVLTLLRTSVGYVHLT